MKWLILFLVFANSAACQSVPLDGAADMAVRPSGIDGAIRWENWDETAFHRAQEEGKLILLDLTAVWCHACHVMDETTYSTDSIIELLHARFVPVRVDTDHRPDIEARYRHGGWPTTSVLLPTGEIVFQANFLEPDELQEALLESEKLFNRSKNELLSRAADVWAKVEAARRKRTIPSAVIDQAILAETASIITQNFDDVNGGFREAPKFFEPDAITFLFDRYHQTGDQALKRMAVLTLDQQRRLVDPVWGGFYRYAEKTDWTQPHYEKMLHLQAANINNYLEAYQVTGNPSYKSVVDDTMDYIEQFLLDTQRGGFFASQDADVRRIAEGDSYTVPGDRYFGLGNAERVEAGIPQVDRTIYTGWNALIATSYLKAFQVFGKEKCLTLALSTLNRLYDQRYVRGRGIAHVELAGTPEQFGLLRDQVFFGDALLHAFISTGENMYLARAKKLGMDLLSLLEDQQGGGFYDRPSGSSDQGLLKFQQKSLEDNTRVALLLSNLYYLTEKPLFRDAAKRTLHYVLGSSGALPLALTGVAVDRFLRYPVHIVIVGSREDDKTARFFREGLRIYAPGKIVRLLDPSVDSLRIAETTFPRLDEPRAYACTDKLCSEPAREPAELPSRYGELVKISRSI